MITEAFLPGVLDPLLVHPAAAAANRRREETVSIFRIILAPDRGLVSFRPAPGFVERFHDPPQLESSVWSPSLTFFVAVISADMHVSLIMVT